VAQKRPGPGLTVEDWIMVHLLRYARYAGEFEVPWAMTQYGIAEAVGTGQDHVSRAVRRLVQRGILSEAKGRVEGVSEKRKVYSLTPEGQLQAAELSGRAEQVTVRLQEGDGDRPVPLKEATALLGPGYTMIEVARAVSPDGRLDRKALEAGRRSQETEVAQSLSPPARFVGRARELATLREWVEQGRMVVIQGIPGIGKTALAARLAADVRGLRPVFWYRFHEWDSPRNLLAPFGEFLAQQGRRKLKMYLAYKQDIDMGEACYIIQDSARGLEALVVFDDVHKASETFLPCLTLFTEMLPGGLRFILTTRNPGPFYDRRDVIVRGKVCELRLEGLDEPGTRELLRARNIGDEFHLGAFRMTGGHPLALELFVPGAEEAERRGNISKYIGEEISARLSCGERTLLRMASVFRYPVPADALFREEGPTYDVLDGLVARSLLRESATGLFDIHDFLRDFFYSRMTPRERAALHMEASRYYWGLNGPRPHLELIHHLLKAGEHGQAADAMAAHGEELLATGFVEELRRDIGELDTDRPAKAGADIAYIGGRAFDIVGDWDRALGFFGRALASGDRGRQAEVHYRIGWIQQKRNLWKEAAESFRLGLALSRDDGDRKGQARANHGLGRVLWRQGRWSEAARMLHKSISMARLAGEEALEASAGIELGRVLASDGEYVPAEKSLRRSLSILEKLGDHSETARAYNTIGWEILRPQGKLDEALEMIHKGEELALSRGDLRELAPIYHSLGELWARKGYSEKATEYFHKSLELFEKQRDVHGAAYNHLGLAIIASAGRQFERAGAEFEKALAMFETASTPRDIAYAYEEYSRMWQAKGDQKKAAACTGNAKRIMATLRRIGRRGSR
jgi:ATP/maltotriose-dependent transcriptional regulator MalT/DNA-binding MarR family transcriptional regulator